MREVALAMRADSAFVYFSNRMVLETNLGKSNPVCAGDPALL